MRLFRRVLPMPDSSQLFNDQTFYGVFMKDLKHAKSYVYIESPFMTMRRMDALLPTIIKLRRNDIRIIVNTRNPDEHDFEYAAQATFAVQALQEIGVKVRYTVKHHRKLAIIDDEILWEGSLNILSQNDSCELMRRSVSRQSVNQMMQFVGFK